MLKSAVNPLLTVLLIAAAALAWFTDTSRSRPNFEFLPDMVHSVPYDSFAANPVFADGKTLQQPVAGTRPREFVPLHYEATPEDAARAGEELTNPYSLEDQAALARGKRVFEAACRHCHGFGGLGDGPVAMRGFPAPPSLLAPEAVALKDGQVFHVITYGKGNMPAHAAQTSREDRWKAILHIRSMQLDNAPPETPQSAN